MTEDRTALRNYLVITGAYWAFTLTDGALRMLVLGYFHAAGYSPFQLALLFLLYEVFGVITNLLGGWIGSRTGLRFTLLLGLSLQIGALIMLSGLGREWDLAVQVVYVVLAQGISGIAKDFTKMSSKSAIKVLVPEDNSGRLFRWVALLTGSKNTLKGLGFFLGGVLLSTLGFRFALWSMVASLAPVALLVALSLPRSIGASATKQRFAEALRGSRAVKLLSAARLFLFCARDIWFVVALPVFLADVLGWSFLRIGTYLALWVVGYGAVQALSPKLLPYLGRQQINDARVAQVAGGILALVPLAIYVALRLDMPVDVVVLGGLGLFGVAFAINSAVHSYLILAYSKGEKVSLNVGFYYMANAIGRLAGTLLSGVLYQSTGLGSCLLAATVLVALSTTISLALPDTRLAA
ncbi:MAG: organoarsenical effux MFS transporter ArsJ [Myxococcales bacterium]|nr:organoarsenical effux MFS transporter ArsJ [Myxococcales bacterium]